MPVCCLLGILNTDLSLFIEIHLGSHQQFGDALIDFLEGNLHPFGDIPKWILIDNGEHKDNSINPSKKALSHIDISLLPSSVPNLQPDITALVFNLLDLVVYPDCWCHRMRESLVAITIYYACLAYAGVAHHDYFEWGHWIGWNGLEDLQIL